jgi:GTP-binding nuclear protein Ran
MNKYIIKIFGDSGVGKTTFLKRHIIDKYIKNYSATINNIEYELQFDNNNSLNIINDISEQDDNISNIDGAIIMFDVTCRLSYKNVKKWHKLIISKYGNDILPIILCGNKIDLVTKRKIKSSMIEVHKKSRKYKILYYDISAESNYNYEKIFFELLKLINKNKLYDPNNEYKLNNFNTWTRSYNKYILFFKYIRQQLDNGHIVNGSFNFLGGCGNEIHLGPNNFTNMTLIYDEKYRYFVLPQTKYIIFYDTYENYDNEEKNNFKQYIDKINTYFTLFRSNQKIIINENKEIYLVKNN